MAKLRIKSDVDDRELKGLIATLRKADKQSEKLGKTSVAASSKMSKGFKSITKTLGAFGVVLGSAVIVKGFSSLINAASDLTESMNKAKVVFGEAFEEVKKFSEGAAVALGASTESAFAMTSEIGNLLLSFGFP